MLVPSTVTRFSQALFIALLLGACAGQQTETPTAKSEVSAPKESRSDAAQQPLVPAAIAPKPAAASELGTAASPPPPAGQASGSFNRLLKPKAEHNVTARLQYAPIAQPPAETARYPAEVLEYRLVGYENRVLRNEDFANDRVDAGDVGAGHTVTALYELTLAGAKKRQVEPLRYGNEPGNVTAAGEATKFAGELGELRIRYKAPAAETSTRIAKPIVRSMLRPLPETSPEYRFAAAVAAFGQLLRGGRHTGSFDYAQVQALARPARGEDRFGYRNEFVQLVDLAKALTPHKPTERP